MVATVDDQLHGINFQTDLLPHDSGIIAHFLDSFSSAPRFVLPFANHYHFYL